MRSLKPENIKKLDKSDMLGLLLDFPQQCRAAVKIAEGAKLKFEKKDFSKIVFIGMGGSAIGADVIRSYLYFECSIPIIVLREYNLAGFVDSSSLAIVSSYSGDTEETLSAYKEAKERGANLIVISSGGRLKESALKDNVTFIEIPKNLPPRCALGYMSIIPLSLLAKLGIIKTAAFFVNKLIETLEELKNNSLKPSLGVKDNIAKTIAAKILNKFVVVYAPGVHFDVCAVRLRGQLAENAKALSSSHVFPEMNHNEIVGWKNPKKLFKDFCVVLMADKGMHPRVAKRMSITGSILNKEDVEIIEIQSRGDDLLSRMFSLIYIGDFISFYLAILYGIDPTPVERVTYLKKELARQ